MRLLTASTAILLAGWMGNAVAALVQRNLFAAQDHLLTFDTSHHLEWLDLTQTVGLSYNEAQASSYVTTLGFRFATPGDLLGLYAAAGITPGSSVDRASGVGTLLDLLGCSTQCSTSPGGQGWLNMGDPVNTAYAFFQLKGISNGPPVVYVGEATLPSSALIPRDLPANSIYRNPGGGQYTGSFLVRNVPEPATYIMMLAGLGLMGFVARRRRR